MQKLIICFLLATSFAGGATAQNYYKDLVSNRQLLADMAAYKENKVKTINIKSFNDDGSESEGFFCQKKLSRDYKRSELFTRADIAPASLFVSVFDNDGKLLNTNDSSSISVTAIKYNYDDKKRIHSILSVVKSQDDDFSNEITEEHIYTYDDNNQPVSMLKIKNRTDTSLISFGPDDKGNIGIEKDAKSGAKFYYYYDAKNRLTDIVQANEYKENLKPDYMFEYNNAGLITQMTSVEEGSSNYFIWKYNYENNLRIKERCFTNERRLMGSIEYEYK
jgi:hypothetical protein